MAREPYSTAVTRSITDLLATLTSGQNRDNTPFFGQGEVSEWSVTATATAAAATATRAAEAGKSHYITGISGSFGAAQIALMTLSDGVTVIGNFHVHNQRDVHFDKPVRITAGNAASMTLAAGAAGVVGAVTLRGYTV